MSRFKTIAVIAATLVVTIFSAVHAFESAMVQQKKMAFQRLLKSGLSMEDAETYSMHLQIALTEATQWEVMDFSVTKSLLRERGGNEECSKVQCATVNGQLLSVDYMCFGTIETIGKTFSLNVQICDVNTGRIVANVSKFFKGKQKVFIKKTIPNVAKQLAETVIGKKAVTKNRKNKGGHSFEQAIEQQAQKSFSDVRGYLAYADDEITTSGKLAFGYLKTGKNLKPDDALRYSYQLQSYLADVGACAMLYIDEMERLMRMRGGNLQCGTKKCAGNVGRLLGVDFMGYGTIRKSFGVYRIKAFIVDVETDEVITKVEKSFRGREIVFLTEIIPQLSYKLGEILERKQTGREPEPDRSRKCGAPCVLPW